MDYQHCLCVYLFMTVYKNTVMLSKAVNRTIVCEGAMSGKHNNKQV